MSTHKTRMHAHTHTHTVAHIPRTLSMAIEDIPNDGNKFLNQMELSPCCQPPPTVHIAV